MTGNAWRILVTACDSPASWFTTHPQLFNIRVDPTNSSRNVLVPWGPDPDNEFPQCVTSCRSSSDLPCAATGFYPAFPGDDARTLLSDQCETITLKDLDPAVQAAAADTWENIELLPVSGPPTPPAPPPLPPIPPPSPPAPPSFSCPNPTTGVLARHNSKRALHTDTPALTWNATLVATAEAQAKLCVWDYATSVGEGENLFAVGGSPADACSSAVDSWYVEVADYDFASPGSNAGIAQHFTQVPPVWSCRL
jgi:hypothetical protein